MEALNFLAAPLLMCLILVGIHCYLGIHVLARGVIFVDLALAQVAALGATVPFFFFHEPSSLVKYLFSLGFTLGAAAFLTLSNRFRQTLSQEAVIGVLFAFCSASLIVLADQMPHGSEHLKHSMIGQLLWTTWADVLKVFIIYSGVSGLYYIFRKPLLANSLGIASLWSMDFLFYALFAVVITSSVQVAGILIVFSFLIVPALLSAVFFKDVAKRLWFGWGIGAILSVFGMFGSYYWNLPSGAFIVGVFTCVPLLLILVKAIFLNKANAQRE
ncbi:MAG TPA: metal ABC transporter permease [Oligoflexia bacterium]|nr:metal ABC transporter permease [Oligoflexia bacterium]